VSPGEDARAEGRAAGAGEPWSARAATLARVKRPRTRSLAALALGVAAGVSAAPLGRPARAAAAAAPATVAATAGREPVDGASTDFFAPARLGALPPARRAAWVRYLEGSARLGAADRASIDAELRAAGKVHMTPAPYCKAFRFEPGSMTPAWLRGEDGRKMAAAMLSFQTPSGGWSKHVDMTGRPRLPGESYYSETDRWSYIATIDNDSTTEELRFLAAALAATGDTRLGAAFVRGVGYLLSAQFPNGGWPQVYPLSGGYHDAITNNDDAMVNVMRLLGDLTAGRLAPVPAELRARAAAALSRGLRCLLDMQVVERGVRTVWAQQHDPLTLAPVPARSYELASLAGRESANVTSYLMGLPAPDGAVVAAVHAAVAWFRGHALTGLSYSSKTGLVHAAGGPPLWARMSELGTGRPIFSNRDGVKRYDWNELTDRRTGYAWYSPEPAGVLAAYDAWAHAHPPTRQPLR
jgi:PelA/Pel-15E family pectate lyase